MADEILERYANASHPELYEQLMAGDPEQVEGLAAHWHTAHDTVSGLAGALRRDLDQLMPNWHGTAGHEFQRRVGAVVTFAETLAGELDDIRSGLTTMAAALREAQREAESPEQTDDHDRLLGGVGNGALSGSRFGVPGVIAGGVIGGITGYNQDEKEKEAARQRTIQLVVELAAEYRITEQSKLVPDLIGPPEGLPTGSPDTRVAPVAGPRVTAPTQVSELDASGTGPDLARTSPTQTGDGPGTASKSDLEKASTGSLGTGLLGAGGGAPLGAAGTGAASGLAAGAGGAGGAAAAAAAGGAGGAAVAGGGALGTKPSGLSGAAAGRASGPAGGTPDRAATGARRGVTEVTRADRRAATPGSRRDGQDEPREYTTWLTEDEMVWGDDDLAPPSVLGCVPPAPPAPPQRRTQAD